MAKHSYYGIIYVLIDPRNESVRYVGQTTKPIETRFQQHILDCRRHKFYSAYWIKHLLSLDIKPRYVIIDTAENREELNELEIFWIAQYRRLGYQLTNDTEGGEGQLGRKVSEETRQKLSEAGRGRKCPKSEEHKRKLSEALKGRKVPEEVLAKRKDHVVSEETRKKISQAGIGRTPTEETKQRLRASNIGKKHNVSEESRSDASERMIKLNKSEEMLKKRAEYMKGRRLSDATRKKMSDSAKLRPPMSEKHKQNLSKALKEYRERRKLENVDN